MMSTRPSGIIQRADLRNRLASVRSWSRKRRLIAGSSVLLLAILGACSGTNTYPIDIYSAMHYQESFRTLEPPRFLAPEGAVPVDGRAPVYTTEQITQLDNPIPADEASIAMGQQLYNVNCAVCHGEGGNGDGPMAQRFIDHPDARPPAVLTADQYVGLEDNFFYGVLVNGRPPWMPAFDHLLEGEEMWHLINYIRSLQGATG